MRTWWALHADGEHLSFCAEETLLVWHFHLRTLWIVMSASSKPHYHYCR